MVNIALEEEELCLFFQADLCLHIVCLPHLSLKSSSNISAATSYSSSSSSSSLDFSGGHWSNVQSDDVLDTVCCNKLSVDWEQ